MATEASYVTDLLNFSSGNASLSINATQATPSSAADNSRRTITFVLTTLIIAIGMIGIGATVDYKVLWGYIKKPKAYLLGVLMQLLIMPPLAWAFTKIFSMPEAEALGVFIQGCCPGGTTSNVVVYWMDGVTDLSVAMTGTSTLLALGMMPLWLFIYQKGERLPSSLNVPFDKLAIALAALVIPVFIGMVIKVKLPKKANIISKVLIIMASLFILIMVVVNSVLNQIPWIITWRQAVVATIMPLIACGLGYLVTKIPGINLRPEESSTVSVETGLQNVQVAAAVIQISFSGTRAIISMLVFPLLYYLFQVGYCVLFIFGFSMAKRLRCISATKEEDTTLPNITSISYQKPQNEGVENPNFNPN